MYVQSSTTTHEQTWQRGQVRQGYGVTVAYKAKSQELFTTLKTYTMQPLL